MFFLYIMININQENSDIVIHDFSKDQIYTLYGYIILFIILLILFFIIKYLIALFS